MGHRVGVLDPFGVTGAPSDALNPMDLIDFSSPTAADDAAVIARLLSSDLRFPEDPYLAQLQNLYSDWQSLLNNSAIRQVFGTSLPFIPALGSTPMLQRDQLSLTRAGRSPEVLRRISYLCDPEFSGLAGPNPNYTNVTASPEMHATQAPPIQLV